MRIIIIIIIMKIRIIRIIIMTIMMLIMLRMMKNGHLNLKLLFFFFFLLHFLFWFFLTTILDRNRFSSQIGCSSTSLGGSRWFFSKQFDRQTSIHSIDSCHTQNASNCHNKFVSRISPKNRSRWVQFEFRTRRSLYL